MHSVFSGVPLEITVWFKVEPFNNGRRLEVGKTTEPERPQTGKARAQDGWRSTKRDLRRVTGRLPGLLSLSLAVWLLLAGPAHSLTASQIQGVRLGEGAGKDAAASRLVIDLSGPTEILLRAAPGGRSFDLLLLGNPAQAPVPFRPGAAGLIGGGSVRALGGAGTLVRVETKEPASIAGIELLGPEDHGVHGGLAAEKAAPGSRLVLDLVPARRSDSPGGFVSLPWMSNPGRAMQLVAARALRFDRQYAQAGAPADPAAVAALEKRRDELFQRMITDLTNLDIAFEFAGVSTELGDYEGAIVAYERLLIINPDLPRVRYELGVLYFALKSYPAAQTYLESVLQQPDASPDLQQQANALLRQIAAAKTKNLFLGNFTVGMRYQSDGNSAPGSATLRISGSDVRLQGPGTSRSDWNAFANAYFRDTYPLGDGENAPLWESNATLYGTRQILLPNLNLSLLQVTSGVRFHPIAGDSLTIRPHVIGGIIGLDDHLYSDSFGVGMDFTRAITDKLSLDGTIDSSHRDFHNFGAQTTLREQTGQDSGIALRNRYQLTADQQLGIDIGFRHGTAQANFNEYSQYTVGGVYQLTIPPPLAMFELPWALVLNASRIWSEYGGPDPTIDPNVTRHDREWRLSATLAVPFSPVLSSFLQLQSSHIDSTLPNNTYENLTVMLGLTRSF
jgi:tetratricopeptide (TPR) repeat protein